MPLSRVLILLLLASCLGRGAAAAPDVTFFEARVRPLLAERCLACHSERDGKTKGGLALDSTAGILRGGDNGPIVVPGNVTRSRMLQAVRYANPDLQMPPKQALAPEQVADLTAWVAAGAPMPADGPATKPIAADVAARLAWAFHPPVDPPVPAVRRGDWPRSPVDRFVLAKLEERGLAPAAPAGRRALIRRATFDLTGLPPTSVEVEAFVNDGSPDAFARVVDRLLASPAYGQRWARHWLDVARYADSFDARGTGGQADVPFAYRYRDWVVDAFNRDLPYDRFVTEQIAGDLLPPPSPGGVNADGIVATGLYAIGNWPGGDADKEKMLSDIVDDQVDVTGRAFLGLTVACARCHDHKFDPIPTADYYGLAGIFFSSHILPGPGAKTAGSPVLRIPLASPAEVERRRQYEARLAALQKQADGFLDAHRVELATAALPQADRYLAAAAELRGSADQASRAAASRGLNELLLRRWVGYLASISPAAASRGKPLATPVRGVANVAGVDGLLGADRRPCPCVTANGTDGTVEFSTLTLPPRSVAVHPGPSSAAAVIWTSPIGGAIEVAGKVTDGDAHCGNGIAWRLDLCHDGTARTLAAGAIENGGTAAFSPVSGARVEPGDLVRLIVDPKGEYTCDTTVVELRITAPGQTPREWDLARDVAGHLLEPPRGTDDPRSAWSFAEVASIGAAPPANSALATWVATGGDAAAVRDALLAAQLRVAAVRAAGKDPAKDAALQASPDVAAYEALVAPRGPFWGADAPGPQELDDGGRAALGALRSEIAAMAASPPPAIGLAHGLQEGGTPNTPHAAIGDARIHIRGSYERLGDVAPRRFPRALGGEVLPPNTASSGRLELARWVASPANPLTARVMVNRIWQHHFGEGLVRTPNNFGKLGTPPTHPELLDYLAHRFVEGGWSVKAMHRLLMLSATYRQSAITDPATARADPDNLLFGRAARRRLDAEELRDAILVAAGTLDPALGGPAVTDLAAPRRTLYLMTVRSDRNTFRTLFDAADPTAIAERRLESTVAPQALFLLNSPFVIDAAARLAARAPGGADAARVEWLYRNLFGRAPSPAEVRIGVSAAARGGWPAYYQVLFCTNEFAYLD